MSLFGRKKEEVTKIGCCCAGNLTSEKMTAAEETKCCGGIKVLGGGCAKCHELEANTKAALEDMGIKEAVELITDFAVIAAYGWDKDITEEEIVTNLMKMYAKRATESETK